MASQDVDRLNSHMPADCGPETTSSYSNASLPLRLYFLASRKGLNLFARGQWRAAEALVVEALRDGTGELIMRQDEVEVRRLLEGAEALRNRPRQLVSREIDIVNIV
ncbi:hypothetical protein AKJ16_DCAP05589 [Drosera capensis]